MTVTCVSTERVSLENDGAYVAGRLESGVGGGCLGVTHRPGPKTGYARPTAPSGFYTWECAHRRPGRRLNGDVCAATRLADVRSCRFSEQSTWT